MKESKIRKNVLDIFVAYVNERYFARKDLEDLCEKYKIPYGEMFEGYFKPNNLEAREAYTRYKTADDQVKAIREVLRLFYSHREIYMFEEAAHKEASDSYDFAMMKRRNVFDGSRMPDFDEDSCDEDDALDETEEECHEGQNSSDIDKVLDKIINSKKPPEDDVYTIPSNGSPVTYYKKCDGKTTLYENMEKTAIEAREPTAGDYDSQAEAEAGVSDESVDN